MKKKSLRRPKHSMNKVVEQEEEEEEEEEEVCSHFVLHSDLETRPYT